jgi:DNA invertase Pin-like site-specific DNA recombinase
VAVKPSAKDCERTRDKMSAARRKGKWVGGYPVLGYDIQPGGGRLVVNEKEAEQVRAIFSAFEKNRSLCRLLCPSSPPAAQPRHFRHPTTRKNGARKSRLSFVCNEYWIRKQHGIWNENHLAFLLVPYTVNRY